MIKDYLNCSFFLYCENAIDLVIASLPSLYDAIPGPLFLKSMPKKTFAFFSELNNIKFVEVYSIF